MPIPPDSLQAPTARLLVVGDEVLAAEVADANTPLLLDRLADWGVRVTGVRILPDRLDEVAEAMREAAAAAEFVLVTGGIGPTHDDVTRAAAAEATQRPLVRHAGAERRLASIARRPTPDDLRMADIPEGSELLTVPDGPVFGFRVERLYVFPGVPHLLAELLEANRERFRGRRWHRRELVTRLREGQVAAALAELAARLPAVSFGSYPRLESRGWTLRLVVRAPEVDHVEAACAELRGILEVMEDDPGSHRVP